MESDGDRLLLSVVRRNVNNLAQVLAVPIDGSTPPVVVHPGSTQHLFPTVWPCPRRRFRFRRADLGGTQNVHRYESAARYPNLAGGGSVLRPSSDAPQERLRHLPTRGWFDPSMAVEQVVQADVLASIRYRAHLAVVPPCGPVAVAVE
ncbi:MAG: hypothetical protein R3E96_03120 [Planctomycetota bacterium]